MTEDKDHNSVPFYPDHLAYEAKVALWFGVGLILIGAYGLIHPLGVGEPADPMVTPAHAKPEWYFLFLYQLLKFIPEKIGATAPVLALGILALWPFLDRHPDATRRASRIRAWTAGFLTVLIIALTVWGEVS
mgnify:CR=1 FL=1